MVDGTTSSRLKRQRYNSGSILPDRAAVTMTVPFMQAYVNLLIQTCHKRGVAAIGWLWRLRSHQDNPQPTTLPWRRCVPTSFVWCRPVTRRHLGRPPCAVKIALEIFDKNMLGPHQYHVRREEVKVSALDLPQLERARSDHRGGVRAKRRRSARLLRQLAQRSRRCCPSPT